jgi:hypothetical protein
MVETGMEAGFGRRITRIRATKEAVLPVSANVGPLVEAGRQLTKYAYVQLGK